MSLQVASFRCQKSYIGSAILRSELETGTFFSFRLHE